MNPGVPGKLSVLIIFWNGRSAEKLALSIGLGSHIVKISERFFFVENPLHLYLVLRGDLLGFDVPIFFAEDPVPGNGQHTGAGAGKGHPMFRIGLPIAVGNMLGKSLDLPIGLDSAMSRGLVVRRGGFRCHAAALLVRSSALYTVKIG